MNFCGALAHSVPSLTSWQRAPALCCCHSRAEFIRLKPPFCWDSSFPAHSRVLSALSGSLQAHSFWLMIVLTPPPNLSTQLLAKIPRWHYFTNKSTEPVERTGSAVCSYWVFGSSAVCHRPVKAPLVCAEISLPSCLNVTTLPFPTIHHTMSVRIRCSVTMVTEL